jgi:hypothetical protein
MMARLNFNTKCPCGNNISGVILKPTWFVPSITRANCKSCSSRFLISCVRDQELGAKRTFTTHIEILELTSKAQKILEAMPSMRGKIALTKVANAIGFEPKAPNQSAIETDMD